jgi:hypothetical protein
VGVWEGRKWEKNISYSLAISPKSKIYSCPYTGKI